MRKPIFFLVFLISFVLFPRLSLAATSCSFSGGAQITLINDKVPEGGNPFKLNFLLNKEGTKALTGKQVYLITGAGLVRNDPTFSPMSPVINSTGFSVEIDDTVVDPSGKIQKGKFIDKGDHKIDIYYTAGNPTSKTPNPQACSLNYKVYPPTPNGDKLPSGYMACEDGCPNPSSPPKPLSDRELCPGVGFAGGSRLTCPDGKTTPEDGEDTLGICGCKIDIKSLPNSTIIPGRSYGGGQSCNPDTGELVPPALPGPKTGVMTAIGCVPTEPRNFVNGMVQFISFASGGIALILMFFASWRWITAMGNQDSIKKAQDQFTNAFIGLLFILFSVLLMQIVGVDILAIPGFTA